MMVHSLFEHLFHHCSSIGTESKFRHELTPTAHPLLLANGKGFHQSHEYPVATRSATDIRNRNFGHRLERESNQCSFLPSRKDADVGDVFCQAMGGASFMGPTEAVLFCIHASYLSQGYRALTQPMH